MDAREPGRNSGGDGILSIDDTRRHDEALEFLRLLWNVPPPGYLLLWLKKGGASLWFPASDLPGMATAAVQHATVADVYMGCACSPGDYGRKQRCPANQVSGIPGLWLDVDVAGSGHKNQALPATPQQALQLINSMPLPPSLVVHSGHGLQPWWLLEQPWMFASAGELQDAAALCKAWEAHIQALAKKEGWSVDSTADLARILRLPGTINRKETKTPVDVAASIPDTVQRYSVAELGEALEAARQVLAGGRESTSTSFADLDRFGQGSCPIPTPARQPESTLSLYVKASVEAELQKLATTPQGKRNVQLNISALALGQFVGAGVLSRSEAESRLTAAANATGLDRDPGCGPGGIAATIKSGLDKGIQEPRNLSHVGSQRPATSKFTVGDRVIAGCHGNTGTVIAVLGNGRYRVQCTNRDTDTTFTGDFPEEDLRCLTSKTTAGLPPSGPEPLSSPTDERIIVRASEIETRDVAWLWPGRIPLAKLTTFAGQTGQGKTFVACDIAARITVGSCWPDGKPSSMPPGQVIYITGDDDIDDTLVPRMKEAGAILDRIVFLKETVQAEWTMKALATLDRAILEASFSNQQAAAEGSPVETRPPVRLVVIDPPTSFLPGVDDHKNAELRSVLTPFKDWAKKQSVAVIFITHVNKGGSQVDAIMRVMGSVAWVTGVRAAFMFALDPGDNSRQLFLTLKTWMGPKPRSLSYRIVSGEKVGRIEWLGEVDITADEAINKPQGKVSRGIAASEWLVERFNEKLEWESEALWDRAKQDGISRNAMFEAKNILSLPRARRVVGQDGSVTWIWWVPPDWPRLASGGKTSSQPGGQEEPLPD